MASRRKQQGNLATKQDLKVMASDLTNRIRLAGLAGQQFSGDRDLFSILGYKRALRPLDFLDMYYREDIAQRIVDAFPAATWRGIPVIKEDETEEQTEFEKAIEALADKKKLWHYCERVDKLCGLGRYSILILGVNDGSQLKEPLTNAKQLNWLMPVTEAYAEVASWIDDPADERFGMPKTYNVTMGSEESSTQPMKTLQVHHTRVIHIAENKGQDEVYGTPRLESVYNRIFDLQKVVGGSAEMFWLGARNGLVFEADKEAQLTSDDVDALEDDAEAYQHQMRRLLTSKGGSWRVLESQTPDPRGNVEVLISLIAGAKGMPQRILTGSEAGQLASSQDDSNWNARIDERKINFAEPVIIRPLIDRLIMLGIIPPPSTGSYLVEWPMSSGLSEKEKAEIGEIKARALATYSNAIGADMIMPVEEFRENLLNIEPMPDGGFDEEEELGESELPDSYIEE